MSEKQILQLYEARDDEALGKLLRDLEDKELRSLLDNRAVRGKGDPSPLLRAIFFGSPVSHNQGVQRRLLVFKYCITLLQKHDVAGKIAAEIIGVLLLETDAFPSRCLATLATFYVDSIKSGSFSGSGAAKSLELFPKILSAVDGREIVQSGDNTMKGTEFKSHVLNSVCSGRWDSGSVLHLAAMFKDVPLSVDELGHVIQKVLRMFRDVDLQELPPLVYQLLLLSTKGHKRQVLEGVSQFFVQQDTLHMENKPDDMELSEMNSSDQLRHIEGTVILHVSFAMKQDQELGRELIKYLKGSPPQIVLAPFNIALALSVSRIHRFEEQISEYLKSMIVRSYKDEEKCESSQWVRSMAPHIKDEAAQILITVKNSTYGWDSVVQGLVHVGFLLMDTFGPKAAFGRILDPVTSAHPSPTQKACQLGAAVLQQTFKCHEMVRGEILEQILNRVITKATSPTSHFIDLLSSTVTAAPQILLDSVEKVKEALNYLSYLPPFTAHALLKAIHPLLKLSMGLKDTLILVLRKAMFSRQVEARQIAVNGFFLILKNFKVLGGLPSSQASQSITLSQLSVGVDVHMPYNAAGNEALCLEILGSLRRALTQQASVRLTLYQGFYEVLCRNSQLSPTILTVIFNQFEKYYEKQEDVKPPLKIAPCILTQGETVTLVEPLSELLCCLVQCLIKSELQEATEGGGGGDEEAGGSENSQLKEEIKEMLESLSQRMAKSELEDFELDKSADFSASTTVGQKNSICAHQVASIYEVLIEYNFLLGNFQLEACQVVLQLFQNYSKLEEIIREKCTGGAGAGKNSRAVGTSTAATAGGGGVGLKGNSHLSIKFLAVLIKSLISNVTPAHQEALGLLRGSPDLLRFVLSCAVSRLQQISDKCYCAGPEGHSNDKLIKYISNMARHLFRHYSQDVQSMDGSGDASQAAGGGEKKRQCVMLALEAFSLCVSTVCARFRSHLVKFLTTVDPNRSSISEDEAEQVQELLHAHIKKFQRMVMTIISASDEADRSMKEVIALVGVIAQLSRQLLPGNQQMTQVQAWLMKLATETDIDDSAVMKCVMTLLIELTLQQKSVASLLKQIAGDIHTQLGDIDQEVELAQEVTFSILTLRSCAPSGLLMVLQHVERELDDTDWAINALKAQAMKFVTSANTGDDTPELSQREDEEKSVCVRLGHMVNLSHELVQTAVPLGSCIDAQLKLITHLYNTLTLLTKYYLSLYQMKTGHMSNRFEKLVKISGTNLTHYVYPMITYMQATQKESMQQAAEKKKKKEKKAEAALNAGKARVLKETKNIPSLIFSIEQFERFLIQLSKKSKVNLMEHFKMSTSRDFRINAQSLQAAIEAQEESSEDEEEETMDVTTNDKEKEEEDEENHDTIAPPAAKKAKTDGGKKSRRKLGSKNN